MIERSTWPFMVRLGLWALPNRGLAWAVFWVSIAIAVACVVYGFLDSRFFDDGRIQLDTGHLERSIRRVATGRKNFLFFGSLRSGQAAATLYSVVQSARLYRLDVAAYLTDVLRRLPAIQPMDAEAIRRLLPDFWAKSHPEHIVAPRDEELRGGATGRRRPPRTPPGGGGDALTVAEVRSRRKRRLRTSFFFALRVRVRRFAS